MGLNYIAGSHKNSLKHFFDLPDKKLFPKDKVPTKKSDKFTWSAILVILSYLTRTDFINLAYLKTKGRFLMYGSVEMILKGRFLPLLIDIGNVEKKRYKDLGMFSGSTNFSGRVFFKKKKSFVNLFSKKLYGIKKFLKF